MESLNPLEIAKDIIGIANNIVEFGISRMSIRAWSEMPQQMANFTYYEYEPNNLQPKVEEGEI